jgi:hypothetical protein
VSRISVIAKLPNRLNLWISMERKRWIFE